MPFDAGVVSEKTEDKNPSVSKSVSLRQSLWKEIEAFAPEPGERSDYFRALVLADIGHGPDGKPFSRIAKGRAGIPDDETLDAAITRVLLSGEHLRVLAFAVVREAQRANLLPQGHRDPASTPKRQG